MVQIEKELTPLSKHSTQRPLTTAWFDKLKGKAICEQSAAWLEWAFTIDEIKSAVFDLPSEKLRPEWIPHVIL